MSTDLTKTKVTKQERIAAVLEPRYDNLGMWHYRGGNINT
jgi:hypothetical protein